MPWSLAAVEASRVARRDRLAQRIAEGKKRCGKCREIEPLEAFGHARSSPDGRHGHCSSCSAADKRDRYARDPAAATADRARSARGHAARKARAAAERAEAEARAAAEAARIAAAITVASDPRTDRLDLAVALSVIPASELEAVARARVAAVRANVAVSAGATCPVVHVATQTGTRARQNPQHPGARDLRGLRRGPCAHQDGLDSGQVGLDSSPWRRR